MSSVGEWADPALADMISQLLYEDITNGSDNGWDSFYGCLFSYIGIK